jgi:circadian clock protein KaiA
MERNVGYMWKFSFDRPHYGLDLWRFGQDVIMNSLDKSKENLNSFFPVTPEPRNNYPPLLICAFSSSGQLAHDLTKYLDSERSDRYRLLLPQSQSAFCQTIEQEGSQIDCLIFKSDPMLPSLVHWLHDQAMLLPAVILLPDGSDLLTSKALNDPEKAIAFTYHTAERRIPLHQLPQMGDWIDRAIAEFLHLSHSCLLPPSVDPPSDISPDLSAQNFLLLQQRRLSEKLKERLGYMGVYYKRNPRNFLRNMTSDEQMMLIDDLKEIYRGIILGYFADETKLNEKIDAFVDTAFLADVSVAQVVEIHMDLMGVFAKQLRLEGRSEEVLLDYRLTLIDTLAHLCEMYRRSIPRDSPES